MSEVEIELLKLLYLWISPPILLAALVAWYSETFGEDNGK